MTARGLTASAPSSRIEALQSKHAMISGDIEEAHRSPSTTDYYLRQLKKKRLQLKEEIENMRKRASA